MGEEIDRMMRLKRLTIIFLIAFLVIVAGIICVTVIMGTGDYSGANSDFAELEAYDQSEAREYSLNKFDTLLFFSEAKNNERTLFLDEVPNVKIVNSHKYVVKITTNKSLFEKLNVTIEDEMLSIGFDSKFYNEIERNGRKYGGLYVDCSVFDVTVYAPISTIHSNAEFNLDFEAPKTKTLGIVIGGEIREGKVHNIDTDTLVCSLSGASNVELFGKVSGTSQLEVWHDSKINAEGLKTNTVITNTSCQIFGFSSIVGQDFSDYSFTDMGFLLSVGSVLVAFVAAGLTILFYIKYRKTKKEIDLYIEKVETEGKFLTNTEKTYENLLQNRD